MLSNHLAKFIFIISWMMIMIVIPMCGSNGSSSDEDVPEVPVPTIKSKVGLSAFGLCSPNFPVQRVVDIFKDVPEQRPAYAFVYKAFGNNLNNYTTLQESFGGQTDVQIYVLCGPCRRMAKLEWFYPQYDVSRFTQEMKTSKYVEASYTKEMTNILNNYIVPYPDTSFTIIPELESNLDVIATKKILELTKNVLKGYDNVKVAINPLGNSRIVLSALEIHTIYTAATTHLKSGDIVNFDGSTFLYPNEANNTGFKAISFDDTKSIIRSNINRNVFTFLWRPDWQGISNSAPVGTDANQRNYIYKPEHDVFLTELLRIQ